MDLLFSGLLGRSQSRLWREVVKARRVGIDFRVVRENRHGIVRGRKVVTLLFWDSDIA